MRRKGTAVLFPVLFILLLTVSVLFVCSGEPRREWKNQTILRMEVSYEKGHPTGMAAEYFAKLVREESNGEIEIEVTYNTDPGSEKEIVTQLQFGGIAFAAVNYLALCGEIPEINGYIGSYGSPEEAQEGYIRKMDGIRESLSKERMELLACYRPDYRCIAVKDDSDSAGGFAGMKIHAADVPALSAYLLGLGAELENSNRTDLLRAVDSGFIDGSEMPLLLYNRAGYDKVMPYLWINEDLLVPDVLAASTVSLGNLTDGQQRVLAKCAGDTLDYQAKALEEAQQKQAALLAAKGAGKQAAE